MMDAQSVRVVETILTGNERMVREAAALRTTLPTLAAVDKSAVRELAAAESSLVDIVDDGSALTSQAA
jgi:hypothetical protein